MDANDVMDTLIMLMFVASIISTFVTTVQDVNTTNWTFTGASGASTIWGLLPFIFITAFVMGLVAKLLYGRTKIGAWHTFKPVRSRWLWRVIISMKPHLT